MQKTLRNIIATAAIMVLAALSTSAQSTDSSKGSLKVSGFVQLIMSEDFGGYIDNYDFIPALIDVSGSNNVDQQFRADFSTSRLNFDYSKETEALGEVKLHMDVDFRGGSQGSYTPRMRRGFITIGNWVAGKNFTNFMDVNAMLGQIDFQGSNGYCFNYSPQLRYTYVDDSEHLSLSASLEYLPQSLSTSILGSTEYERITQRLPTVPIYAQYNFGEARYNHVRLSGIVRPQSVYKVSTDETLSRVGWGAQFSGRLAFCPALFLYYNAIYGAGIAEYINDLYGSEMEYTITASASDGIETTEMYSYNVGLQVNLSKRVWCNVTYSSATIGSDKDEAIFGSSAYHTGNFAFGNIYFQATPDLQFVAEYLNGKRENMNGESGKANRIYLMAQYNF